MVMSCLILTAYIVKRHLPLWLWMGVQYILWATWAMGDISGPSSQLCRCNTEPRVTWQVVGQEVEDSPSATSMAMAMALDQAYPTFSTWRSCPATWTACLWSGLNVTWSPSFMTHSWTETRWISTLTPWRASRGSRHMGLRPLLTAGCLGKGT